ncbi:BTB domain-containing protein [Oryctes borbonicus]|uniref:BTB domain-containing protein n=1 Tax=Oryctes borbonicus TaxID=1629725 RepID=A0A0T6B2P8_9SCAR|nr:BTB domain-containing protein [Oryctes borbonicus]
MSSVIPLKVSYKREKFKCLLKTQDHADCTFICGDEKISAHRLILACSSPVFELMFFGQMAATEVELPDINPDDFRKMLEYIYTDYVDIGSVQTAWSLIYIGQKYFLGDLLELCVDFVKTNLTLVTYFYVRIFIRFGIITRIRLIDLEKNALS